MSASHLDPWPCTNEVRPTKIKLLNFQKRSGFIAIQMSRPESGSHQNDGSKGTWWPEAPKACNFGRLKLSWNLLVCEMSMSIFFASIDNCSLQIQYVSKPFAIGSDQTSWSQVWFMRLRVAISDFLNWTSLRFKLFQEQLHHEEVSTDAAFPWGACL